MATADDARFIQQRLGYSFQDEKILLLALTAAGKGGTEDGIEKQGNSRLAHFGNYLIQFVLAWVGFSGDRTREDTSLLRTRLTSTDHCAKVAENAELNRCLKYDIRSGSKSAVVLRKALNATIAAVFVDSRDLDTVLRVAQYIGLFEDDEFGIDPRFLSTNQTDAIESFRNTTRPAGVQEFDGEVSGETRLTLAEEESNQVLAASEPGTGADLAVAGNAKRRRVHPNRQRVQRADNNVSHRAATWLSQYLEEERERCICHNIKPPEETFFTKNIQEQLRGIGKRHANTCILVQVLIASPCAFVTLRELVSSYKAEDDFHLWRVNSNVSAQARFSIIRHLDGKIAAYGVLRRYHILHLFQESVPAESRILTNFINVNPTDLQRNNRPGNPGNNAKSEVTQEMMRAIYPGLHPPSKEYSAKHRAISRLRVLGERYHAMVDRFQEGILGLLPICGLAKPFDLGISDNMILALPDTTFNDLLDVLDRTQGDLLRKSSEAAMRLIGPLMNDAPQRAKQFSIETYKLEDIIQHPKGSKELLSLLDQCNDGGSSCA